MIADEAASRHVRSAARDWLLILHERPDDAELHAAFAEWISASDAHAEAWARAEQAWRLMDGLAPPLPTRRHFAMPAFGRPSRRQLFAWASAGIAVGAAALLLPLTGGYRTGTGERRRLALADGSRVDLDSQSLLDVTLDGRSRSASLRKGRAFFDVAHDNKRPFTVTAGDTRIRVLGTAFAVEHGADGLSVSVARGRVVVRHGGDGRIFQLAAADRLLIEDDGSVKRTSLDASRMAAWRDGKIYAVGRSVRDLIGELRRYHQGIIVLNAPKLAARLVTGVYHLDRPVQTIGEIVAAHHGTMTVYENYIIYISDT